MGNMLRSRKKALIRYSWRIAAISAACTLLYYLPVIVNFLGGASLGRVLGSMHDFYGIDFYGMLFFAPVVYTAYVLGINWAILVAFAATLIVIPYAVLFDPYPNVLFKPTAYAIILSAVGAVVAMLQKSDAQRRQSVKELTCLHDIGKAAEERDSLDAFITAAVKLIPQAMPFPEDTGVRITVRDSVFASPDFAESPGGAREDLAVGGEILGSLEICCPSSAAQAKVGTAFVKTLAERISGAVRGIELEQSLQSYYGQLEEMVEKRTHDLELVQEKLIRAERLAAVGELASGVGHELRNPLNVIRNCVYLLHMGLSDQDEEGKKTLAVLDKQIDIANRIVTDLLDFTRIKPPASTRFSLNSLVRESLSWVVVPENVKVVSNMNGKSPSVQADSEQIGRAFANIISNAVQAISGSGELRLTTGAEDGTAWAKFEDTGCGIPEENLEKIFEPLFTTKPKGIGLGLAITRRLVEQNSGKIEVISQVGKGTTFTVRLPLPEERQA